MFVLAPRHQALVSREVRESSLMSMVGVPDTEDIGVQEKEKKVQEAGDQCEGLNLAWP